MHHTISHLATGVVALTGGWFLHAGLQKPQEKAFQRIPVVSVATSVGDHIRAKVPVVTDAPRTGNAHSGPQPFTSLDELVTLIDGLNMDDELCFVEMMAGIPRLLRTDLNTTKRLLTELEQFAGVRLEFKSMLGLCLIGRWMMEEPERAVEFAVSHPAVVGAQPGSPMRAEIIEEYAPMAILMLAKTNSAAARDLVKILPEEDREDTLEMLLRIEAAHDPESALKALAPDKSDDAEAIVMVWAQRDPQAALRWISTRPEDVRDDLMEAIDESAGTWGRRDPRAALQWVASQPEEDREDLLKSVAGGWAKKDWKEAAAWAAKLPEDIDPGEIYSAISGSIPFDLTLADAEPALGNLPQALADHIRLSIEHHQSIKPGDETAAAARVMEILKRNPDDEAFHAGSVFSAIAGGMAGNGEGAAAANWINDLPPGPAQDSAAAALARGWAEKDPEAASQWLTTLPAGEMCAKATAQLVEQITASDPERALKWAKTLPDQDQRNAHIGRVLREWLPSDPFAAMDAVEALPVAVRSEIWSRED
ncbi:MAG TPA: hypothetical protein VG796_30175 [Verrucomicrobiales bacterium]|nr:hypothetical protein [Verrucomicrobiales bacterium]